MTLSLWNSAFVTYWLILWSDYGLTVVPLFPLRARWVTRQQTQAVMITTAGAEGRLWTPPELITPTLVLLDTFLLVWVLNCQWVLEHRVECLAFSSYNQFFNESHIMCLIIYIKTIGSPIEHRFKVSMSAWTGNIKNKAGDFVVAAHRAYPPILSLTFLPPRLVFSPNPALFLLEDVTQLELDEE